MDSDNQIKVSQKKLKQFYQEQNSMLRDYLFQKKQLAKEALPIKQDLVFDIADSKKDLTWLNKIFDIDIKLIYWKGFEHHFPYKKIIKQLNDIAKDKRVVVVNKSAIIFLFEFYYRARVVSDYISIVYKKSDNSEKTHLNDLLKDYKTYMDSVKDNSSFKSVSLNSSDNSKQLLSEATLMMLRNAFEQNRVVIENFKQEFKEELASTIENYALDFDKLFDLISLGNIRKFEKAVFPTILHYIILQTDLKGFKPKSEVRRDLLANIFKLTHPQSFEQEDFELTDKKLYRRQQVRTIIGV